MLKHRQRFLHNPSACVYGDCHRTAIACLLDLPLDDVPHWAQKELDAALVDETYSAIADIEQFLHQRGLYQVHVSWSDLHGVFGVMQNYQPNALYILGGQSERGTNHSVICLGGGFYWDPHPDSTFVCKPLSNGFYESTFLVPLSMTIEPKEITE